MRGSEDIARDPEKLQKFLDLVAMLSSPVPGVGLATGLGADVFRSQHGGMGRINAAASALPIGIAIGKSLGGAPVGSLVGALANSGVGLSTVQASEDDLARAAARLEKMTNRAASVKQAAEESAKVGALTSNMPKAAALMKEYRAIPAADHIARAIKEHEIATALFGGVQGGFTPTGGALSSALGRAQPSIPLNKLVRPY